MSQYQISKKRLAQIIKEEYQNLQELEDPRSPSPMSYEHEGAADDFRKQIMNLVLQLGPLTLDPKTAAAVEVEIRDVLNTLNIGSDPRGQYRQEESLTLDQVEMDEEDYELDEKLDPVGEEDDDVDNDGDSDSSDKYLKKRRQAIGKAMKKESVDSIRQLIQLELSKL